MAKIISESGDLRLFGTSDGFFHFAGDGTYQDRNAILRDLAARLRAISPEALDLARAFAAAAEYRTADQAAASARVRAAAEKGEYLPVSDDE